MTDWPLSFISEKDFMKHVASTIEKYGEKLKPYDLAKFNKNIVDPVKMVFDKTVYQSSWQEIIGNEIFRQRDKSNTNDIGYFHQRMFQYIKGCNVPPNGKDGGWDVIFKDPSGIRMPEGDVVHTIYVEMKNKHNTMNSAAAGKTYIKMQHQLLEDDDCACFLVEAIAKRSQDIKWTTTVDGKSVSHRRIRRVSIDRFYALVTDQEDAFFQVCMLLPQTIEKVVNNGKDIKVPHDTVLMELKNLCNVLGKRGEDLPLEMAIYLLGFSSYNGFRQSLYDQSEKSEEDIQKRLYEYAKKI